MRCERREFEGRVAGDEWALCARAAVGRSDAGGACAEDDGRAVWAGGGCGCAGERGGDGRKGAASSLTVDGGFARDVARFGHDTGYALLISLPMWASKRPYCIYYNAMIPR